MTTPPATRPSTPAQRVLLYAMIACSMAFICLLCSLLLSEPPTQKLQAIVPPLARLSDPVAGPDPRTVGANDQQPLSDQQLGALTDPLVAAVDHRNLSHLLDLDPATMPTPPQAPTGEPQPVPRDEDLRLARARMRLCAQIDQLLARAQDPWEGVGLRLHLFLIHGLLLTHAPPELVAPRIDTILDQTSGRDRTESFEQLAILGTVDHRSDVLDHLQARLDAKVDLSTQHFVRLFAEAAHVAIGKAFPDFALTDLDGHTHHLGAYRGHCLVVHFWSSASPPCLPMADELVALQRRFASAQVAFLGIDGDPVPQQTPGLLVRMPWPQISARQQWPVAPIGPWGVRRLPTWLLIDADGVLRARGEDAAALGAALAQATRG